MGITESRLALAIRRQLPQKNNSLTLNLRCFVFFPLLLLIYGERSFVSVPQETNRFQKDHLKCLSVIISVFSSGETVGPSAAFHTSPK